MPMARSHGRSLSRSGTNDLTAIDTTHCGWFAASSGWLQLLAASGRTDTAPAVRSQEFWHGLLLFQWQRGLNEDDGFADDGAYSVRAMAPTRDVSCRCPRGTYHEAVFLGQSLRVSGN